MLRTLFIGLVAAASCGATYAAGAQKFTISGRIDGLQAGDTLRFERVILPGWNLEQAFDVIVRKPSTFSYKGTQEHDQYYMMTYLPKVGKPKESDRRGKTFIVTSGDRIGMSGTADKIYYCTLSGGIYDEPLLREVLRVEDSLGQARGSLITQMYAFQAAGEKAKSDSCGQAFNNFYQNNPGVERLRSVSKIYKETNPQGTLYRLIELIPRLSYAPTSEARATYEAFSPEIRESYYGQLYARQMNEIERLAIGKPAPDFSVVTTEGKTVTKADFKGSYLLFYHWGMCPGSISIDKYVRGLYDEYKDKGFKVLGLTESIATIRDIRDKMPAEQKVEGPGTDDFRATLSDMVSHTWDEVEVETDYPANKSIMEAYAITGWPFFVLIGPDGTILARDFSPAFSKAIEILNRELGEEKTEAE